VPRVAADEYLLRINSAVAPPGTKTSVHTHPGSEAFYVLRGQVSQRTPAGTHVLDVGETMPGEPGTPMEVSSSGDEELRQLIMFVVDANKPFSTPASFD
jgi:quercetin dioxygenase-like cupin family protein